MLHYIIQVIAFQLLFLVTYDLFLKKETFFQWNRVYLIATSVLSFVLPFIKLGFLKSAIPESYMVQLPAVFIGNSLNNPLIIQGQEVVLSAAVVQNTLTIIELWTSIWLIGMIVSLVVFCYKLVQILALKRQGSSVIINGREVLLLPETDVAFSFLNTIYLGSSISEERKKDILLHEEVHLKQYHSVDLLFFEIFKIIFWFNPLSYVFQKRLELLHEYIADNAVASINKDSAYYQTLLSYVFQTERAPFVNTFFNNSLIKKRIIMLQKSKSHSIFQLKYLILVPLVLGMLLYTSCETSTTEIETKTANLNEDTTEVMQKIKELSEAIMKVGNLSDDEVKALEFLSLEAKPGAKIYLSVEEYLEGNKEDGIPFSVLEQVPVYPGCSGDTNLAQKKCFTEKITAFVGENFDVTLANTLEITGVQKIYVQFKINKSGLIQDVKARASHDVLKDEAIRVVRAFPRMKAGMQGGKHVNVLYSLPIKFNVNE